MHRFLSFVSRLGFTPREVRVILILSAAMLAGLAVQHLPAFRLRTAPAYADETYAESDSEFFARSRNAFPDSADTHRPTHPRRETPRPSIVDVNSATREQLMQLPGIKGAYADRILEYRSRRGGFSGIDDLLGVKGIGRKRLERLRPFVTAGPH
jgi:competence ComEA-like helix-hairpin-helix protein